MRKWCGSSFNNLVTFNHWSSFSSKSAHTSIFLISSKSFKLRAGSFFNSASARSILFEIFFKIIISSSSPRILAKFSKSSKCSWKFSCSAHLTYSSKSSIIFEKHSGLYCMCASTKFMVNIERKTNVQMKRKAA